MTPERLRALIAAGETLTVEFKGEDHVPLNDRDLVEAVVCLANRSGSEPAWLLTAWKMKAGSAAHARDMAARPTGTGSRP